MTELLKSAVEAHGGQDRWDRFDTLTAKASITGAIWSLKGKSGVLEDVSVVANLRDQRLTTNLAGRNRRFVFTPHRVAIETEDGREIESRTDPRASILGRSQEAPWDDLDVAYFSGYALWTYLTIPFLYTRLGFATVELPPWSEDGEVWRPLKATFPDSVASHCREQVSYFGSDGLLRRHEYTVEILGGASGLNYASDYRAIQGIRVPTRRRICASDAERRKVPDPVLVAIDLRDVRFIQSPSSAGR